MEQSSINSCKDFDVDKSFRQDSNESMILLSSIRAANPVIYSTTVITVQVF